MSQKKRQTVLVIVMLAMLSTAVAWSLGDLVEKKEAARFSAEDLQACKDMADQISLLRKGPTIATSREMQGRELGARIDTAARQAGLSSDALVSRDGLSARKLRNQPYLQKPTQLTLRGVTMPQLISFLRGLTVDSGLSVQDLNLTASPAASPAETWDVITTVTYLIYSPSPSRGARP